MFCKMLGIPSSTSDFGALAEVHLLFEDENELSPGRVYILSVDIYYFVKGGMRMSFLLQFREHSGLLLTPSF